MEDIQTQLKAINEKIDKLSLGSQKKKRAPREPTQKQLEQREKFKKALQAMKDQDKKEPIKEVSEDIPKAEKPKKRVINKKPKSK